MTFVGGLMQLKKKKKTVIKTTTKKSLKKKHLYANNRNTYTNIVLTVMAVNKIQKTYFGYLQNCKQSNTVHGNDRKVLIFHHLL